MSVTIVSGRILFAAYAPPALSVGVPIELLPLLLAVDTIPDIFYTVSNVTADLAVTSVVGRNATKNEPSRGALSDQISRA